METTTTANVPTGRVTITGRAIKLTSAPNSRAPWKRDYKMAFLDDRGFRVWGTIPAALVGKISRDMIVTMTATLTPSNDDPTFGFFSRPAKAEIIGYTDAEAVA